MFNQCSSEVSFSVLKAKETQKISADQCESVVGFSRFPSCPSRLFSLTLALICSWFSDHQITGSPDHPILLSVSVVIFLVLTVSRWYFLGEMQPDEKTLWNRKYRESSHTSLTPDPFLVSAWSEYLAGSAPGTALDVAGGTGRHALWLADRGWNVKLVDISEVAIELAKKNIAASSNYPITKLPNYPIARRGEIDTEVQDLRANGNLGEETFDLVLVFIYLQRPLFPALISALKPGGLLIYKTFTIDQQRFKGGPRNPEHLLQPNELLRSFSSLRVLSYRETVREKGVAELVAINERDSRELESPAATPP